MVGRHITFSESIVMKELEKLARAKNLVKEDPEPEVATIKKEASSPILTTTDDVVADVARLAGHMRQRGFTVQANSLEKRLLILKRAMSESGKDSLYDFWQETGDALVEHAHKTTDGDVEGYKVRNISEVKDAVVNMVKSQPTGQQEKAVRMAKMVNALLKEADGPGMGASTGLLKYRPMYDKSYEGLLDVSRNIDILIQNEYLDKRLNVMDKIPAMSKGEIERVRFLAPQNAQFVINLLGKNVNETLVNILMNQDQNQLSAKGQSAQGLYELLPISEYFNITMPTGFWERIKGLITPSDRMVETIKDLMQSGQAVPIARAIEIKKSVHGMGLDFVLTFNQNGTKAATNLKLFFVPDEFKNLVSKYRNTYTQFQSDFDKKLEEVKEIHNTANSILGTLSRIAGLLPENDPNIATIETVKDKIRDGVLKMEDKSIGDYITGLQQGGLGIDSLKESLAGYQSDLARLTGKLK